MSSFSPQILFSGHSFWFLEHADYRIHERTDCFDLATSEGPSFILHEKHFICIQVRILKRYIQISTHLYYYFCHRYF